MNLPSPDALRAPSPDTMDVESLLDHILAAYHQKHRAELPDLVALARKVERVHHDVPEAPLGLGDALEHVAADLESHMQKEEQVLFPAMRQGLGGALAQPISMMRSDHEDHAQCIAEIERLTRGYAVPAGACGSWQRLYAGVESLCAELREHIRIEDDILFPRFEILGHTRCTCAHG
ncbi:hemerythrin domain-containing protein [Aestuariivirga sp.]|uniref:hemerythrin domain-containing protein n=1 Tax=Aestuariivirga sp. TaxID=2650926 RepID=UPI00391C8C32